MRKPALVLAALGCLVAAAPARAEGSAPLEQRLASASGIERVRVLAALTDALKNDRPAQAIAYGEEALKLLPSDPDAALEVRTLSELAWAYMVTGRNDRATDLASRARLLAEQTNDRKGLARALNNLGVIAQHNGEGLQAVDLFAKSLDIYRELRDEANVAGSLNNPGFVYSTELADYEKALTYHVEALKVREALGDKASIVLSLNNIGIVYARLVGQARALDYFSQALALRRALPNQQNRIAAIVNNIGDENFALGDLDKALASHDQALQLRRQVGDQSGVAISLKNLGVAYAAKKRFDRATPALEQGLQAADQAGIATPSR